MASSACPKCNSTSFEVKENTPKDSNYILLFVQCKSCGCVVGTMDYYNIGAKIQGLEKELNIIKHYVAALR